MNLRQVKKLIKAENYIILPLYIKRLTQRQKRYFRKTMRLYYRLHKEKWRSDRIIVACKWETCRFVKECNFL